MQGTPGRIGRRLPWMPLLAIGCTSALLAGCGGGFTPAVDSKADAGSCADPAGTFSTDETKDALPYEKLRSELGALKTTTDARIGSSMKFLGNQYWAELSRGQEEQGKVYGSEVDVQAASSESDQLGQLNAADTMVQKGYDALLVSPQTDTNLCPAVEKAEASDVLVVNVNDAVLPNAQHWVGPNQHQNGVSAAEFLAGKLPDGAEVAVIQGQAGVYATRQRTAGFVDTAKKDGLEVVATVPGDWDVQKARDAATTVLQGNPDLRAFYANNDTMALGVAEAVKSAGRQGEVLIVGTDGIPDAYNAIRDGSITATVDSYPELTGRVAVEVTLRLLQGQDVPRAVYTPQALISKANVDAAPPTLD